MPPGRSSRRKVLDRFLAAELDRRRLLGLSLQAGLGALLAAPLSPLLVGCDRGRVHSGDTDLGDTGTPPSADHTVGIGGGGTVVACAERALALAGGLGFVQPGQTVFLKLNGVSSDPYPTTTSPELLEWLVARLAEQGAGQVRCGDSPWLMADGDALEASGLAAAADRAGVELLDFRTLEDWVEIPTEQAPDWPSGMRLPTALLEADHIINLPTLKTHVVTGATMALKLLIGATHPQDRLDSLGPHDERIDRQIAQINAHITPTLSILDGFEACVAGGPMPENGFEQRQLRIALASRDRVAIDACGLAVLRRHTSEARLLALASPWDLEQIQEAIALGLGRSSLAAADIGFSGVDEDLVAALRADLGAEA
jgi:uncharacterized protein (DUF362 family)